MSPGLTDFQPLDLFYASPFGFLEIIAYSIGMSRGAFLIFAFIQKSPKKPLIIWSYSLDYRWCNGILHD